MLYVVINEFDFELDRLVHTVSHTQTCPGHFAIETEYEWSNESGEEKIIE